MEPVIDQKSLLLMCNKKLLDEDGGNNNTGDCNLDEWYIPKAPSIISENLSGWKEMEKFIRKNIKKYPFVKGCRLSPKDWLDPPVFESVKSCMEAFKNSSRTNNMFILNNYGEYKNKCRHVVMKAKRVYINQSRCFWNGDKLRVVCGNIDHDLVTEFFKVHKYDIPFHYCCLEIGLYSPMNQIELIEINTFGILCDPTPFVWSQNWYELLFSDNTIWNDI
jgi:hypothetical protein